MVGLLLLAACGKVRPGDEPEPPPPEVAKLGCNPAFTTVTVADDAARDADCRAADVAANDAWNPQHIAACVDLAGRRMFLPPDPSAALKAHECAHTWGYTHRPDGTGWVAPAVRYDWSAAFPARTAVASPPRG